MIIKLDRFMQPLSVKPDVSIEKTSFNKTSKTFIEEQLIDELYPYMLFFFVVIGFLLVLQIASTVLLTFTVCYLLDAN